MGQELLNPPTVEGWHTGKEWVDSGSLVGRVNFASDQVGNTSFPGVQDIIRRLSAPGDSLSPEELLEGCLDLAGPVVVGEQTRQALLDKVRRGGDARCDTPEEQTQFAQRVGETLQMIVATREFQFA